MAKLWQKDQQNSDALIESFTIGKDPIYDLALAPYDVLGSMAHVQMLQRIDLLQADEAQQLLLALGRIYTQIQAGNFKIDEGVEDIHSQIEFLLTQELGDLGKKIHAGRSRNDQVLVDLKLFMRDQIQGLVSQSDALFQALMKRAAQHAQDLMPGYTHLQIAMPSSFGLWFSAYAEAIAEDLESLEAAYRLSNKNPLGSGAGYGSSFPLDRLQTTAALGFEQAHVNVINAQMSRGKTELWLLQALANLASTIGKMAMDVCLYHSQNFGFVHLPDAMTTGSSIMPHKKNPDVAELLRGKCNTLKALPQQMMLLMSNLPSGYHREFQLSKELLMPALEQIQDCLQLSTYLVENLEVKADLLKDPKYALLFSVEAVNALVLKGIPFREAYVQVGKAIEAGNFQAVDYPLNHQHLGSIGNLGLDLIQAQMQALKAKFDFESSQAALKQLKAAAGI